MAADAAPTAIAMIAPAEMMPLDHNSCSPRDEALRLGHSAIHSNRKIASILLIAAFSAPNRQPLRQKML